MGWKNAIKVLAVIKNDPNYNELEEETREVIELELEDWNRSRDR